MYGTTDFIDGLVENATAAGALVMDSPTPYLDTIGAFNASQQYDFVTHYSQARPFAERLRDARSSQAAARAHLGLWRQCMAEPGYLHLCWAAALVSKQPSH